MKYIIRFDFPDLVCPYFVGCGNYCVNHERYLVLVSNPNDAKKYSSFSKAKNAIKKMLDEMRYSNLCAEYVIAGIGENGEYYGDDLGESEE